MREIALDTETTGLDPTSGDRIVEIGCVELINHVPTGESFHKYLTPERSMPMEACQVHGLGDDFLADQALFADVAEDMLEFLEDDQLIIHNAEFDMRFLNAELKKVNLPALEMLRATDTVKMARRKFPGSPASLDALCRRFDISTSARTLHGALLDAQLLAEVYLQLIGGRQPDLVLAEKTTTATTKTGESKTARPRRSHEASAEELAEHEAFLKKLKDPLWSAK